MQSPEKTYSRPSSVWVILATCGIVILPVLFLEWEREPARWLAAAAANLAENHQFEEALEKLEQAIAKDPENAQFRLQRAMISLQWIDLQRPWRRRSGDVVPGPTQQQELLRQAQTDVEFALTDKPSQAVRQLCTDIYLRTGQNRAAVEQWEIAAKTPQGIRPETLLNQHAYIRACANLELNQALEQANTALGFLPEPAEARTAIVDTRGYIYYRLKRYQEALSDLDEAVEAYREQTYDLWVQSQREAALSQFGQRQTDELDLSIREAFGTLLYHRLLTHEALGNKDEAQRDREELISLLPGYQDQELW